MESWPAGGASPHADGCVIGGPPQSVDFCSSPGSPGCEIVDRGEVGEDTGFGGALVKLVAKEPQSVIGFMN